MPTQWAHGFYWSSGTESPPAGGVVTGGYPSWQASVTTTIGSAFGALQAWWDRAAWIWGWVRRVGRLSQSEQRFLQARLDVWLTERALQADERLVILDRTRRALLSPSYHQARAMTRETATTLGFNKPGAWAQLGHQLPDKTKAMENAWRHIRTAHRLAETDPTIVQSDKHLIVELAYLGYTLRPREQ
jgi:hypothetical protein